MQDEWDAAHTKLQPAICQFVEDILKRPDNGLSSLA